MNNVVFGNDRFGYYETLGGGTGSGKGFNGSHAVHSHMTNTRITDPEIIEHRYPLRILETSIRSRTGGAGAWVGGDGLIRKYKFLAPVRLSMLTQHRETAPFGLNGGKPGKPGKQMIVRLSGQEEELAPAVSRSVDANEILVVETPGGGGFGAPDETKLED
jgi:5-oxoprolinase (ATP-hydrolysing)